MKRNETKRNETKRNETYIKSRHRDFFKNFGGFAGRNKGKERKEEGWGVGWWGGDRVRVLFVSFVC